MIDSSAPNQPVQNYEIVNPTLEQQVATLLPSVAGYGGNLRSTNTIIPIIDLTTAAEGTTLPFSLQQAIAFGSQTSFDIKNASTVIASSPGFYRVNATSTVNNNASDGVNSFTMTDGVSTKTVWAHSIDAAPTPDDLNNISLQIDLIFWLGSGESLTGVSSKAQCHLIGSSRQVATSAAVLVDPSGFPI